MSLTVYIIERLEGQIGKLERRVAGLEKKLNRLQEEQDNIWDFVITETYFESVIKKMHEPARDDEWWEDIA